MIALAIAASLVFIGGDQADLARRIGEWSQRPVVALVQASQRWRGMAGNLSEAGPEYLPSQFVRPFEIDLKSPDDPDDAKDLCRLLGVRAKLESDATSGGIALWDADWQGSTTGHQPGEGNPLPQGWTEAEAKSIRIAAGRIWVSLPPRESIVVSRIERLPWSRPLRVHWLVSQMHVVVAASGAAEETLLRTLAKATCGRLTVTKGEYCIDLDPSAFRRRAVATILRRIAAAPETRLQAAAHRVSLLAWQQISDMAIQDLFLSRSRIVGQPVAADSPLGIALQNYLVEYREWTVHPPKAMAAAMDSYRANFASIDLQGQLRIAYGQGVTASGAWPMKGGGTVFL